MIYNNLLAEFRRLEAPITDVAKELGFERSAFYNRMQGRTNWTLTDMLKVQEFINTKSKSNYTLDYLFATKK